MQHVVFVDAAESDDYGGMVVPVANPCGAGVAKLRQQSARLMTSSEVLFTFL